jgi:hypothetical protein
MSLGFLLGALLGVVGLLVSALGTLSELRLAVNYQERPASTSLSDLARRGPGENNHVRLHSYAVRWAGVGDHTYDGTRVSTFLPLVAPGREETAGVDEIEAVLISKPAWSDDRLDCFVASTPAVEGVILGRGNFPVYAGFESFSQVNRGVRRDCWVLDLEAKPDGQTAGPYALASTATGAVGFAIMTLCCRGATGAILAVFVFCPITAVGAGVGHVIRGLDAWISSAGSALALAGGTAMLWFGAQWLNSDLYDLSSDGDGTTWAGIMIMGGVGIFLAGLVRVVLGLFRDSPITSKP